MSYSQTEEEGIISDLVAKLPGIPKACIEVGATDGLWLSNTAHLWKDLGWKAVLIESDDRNFINLVNNTKGYQCMCYHRRVDPTGENSIDDLVERGGYLFTGGERAEVGVLSIDIDGDDYHVFENLKMQPWIILVEFNATIPPKVDIVSPVGSRLGCSARALGRMAAERGYVVWDISGSNVVLVKQTLIPWMTVAARYNLAEGEASLGLLNVNRKAVEYRFQDHSLSYLVQDYDGNWAIYRPPIFGFRSPMVTQEKQLWTPK